MSDIEVCVISNWSNTCDKCGLPVPPDNDVVQFEFQMSRQDTIALMFSQSRHLFPVIVGGKKLCPGSPSRAQYIGGAKDPRYPYQEDQEQNNHLNIAFA